MGSPLQNPITEVAYYVKAPTKKNVVLGLRSRIISTLPETINLTNDLFLADIIMQPVFTARNVSDYTEGAVIFQLSVVGEALDFWQYTWRKAKLVVTHLALPYDGYNMVFTPDYNMEDLWRYIH